MPSLRIDDEEKLEAGLLIPARQKRTLNEPGFPGSTPNRRSQQLNERMPPARYLVFTFVVCLLVTLSLGSVIAPRIRPCLDESRSFVQTTPPSEPVDNEFSDLEPDLLHRLLHKYFPERYQHGVFPTDDKALEAVRGDDASLASTLARLAKRQNETSVSPPPPPPPTTTEPPPPPPTSTEPPPPPPTSTSEPPLTAKTDPPPPPDSTTPPPPPPPPPTTNPPNPPPPTTAPPPSGPTTPPPAPGPGPSSVNSSPGAPSPGPGSPGVTALSTPAAELSVTYSPVMATITSTMDNGEITIITSTSYVAVRPTPAQSGTSPSSSAGLQNAAARQGGGSGSAGGAIALAGIIAAMGLVL